MSKARLFLDSSALFAGIVSTNGAGRVLLILGEAEKIYLIVSEQVIVETVRAIARKIPSALPEARLAILQSRGRTCAKSFVAATPSPDQLDFAWLPGLIEERLERAVEAQPHKPAPAGQGLDPVATRHSLRLPGGEVDRGGAIRVGHGGR